MLVGTDVCVRMVFVWECPEETHLSDLVTTWPSHMLTPGIEPGPSGDRQERVFVIVIK